MKKEKEFDPAYLAKMKLTQEEQDYFRSLLENTDLISCIYSGLQRLDQDIIYSENIILMFGHSGVGKTTMINKIDLRFRDWVKKELGSMREYEDLQSKILAECRKLGISNRLLFEVVQQDFADGNLISIPYIRATTSRDLRRKNGIPIEKQGHPHYFVFDDKLVTGSEVLDKGDYIFVMKDWRTDKLVSYGVWVDEIKRCWMTKKILDQALGIQIPIIFAANILEPTIFFKVFPFATGVWLDFQRIEGHTPQEVLDERIAGRQDTGENRKLLDYYDAERLLIHLYQYRFLWPRIKQRIETEHDMVREFYSFLSPEQ